MSLRSFIPVQLVLLLAVPGVILSCNASRRALFTREQTHVIFPAGKPRAADCYVGNQVCGECHEKQFAWWKKTSHADSLNALRTVGSENDPICLRCHVTGYGLKTGYDKSRSDRLDSVGCEACHGPSEGHSSNPGEVKTSGGIQKDCPPCVINRACLLCHTKVRDADFTLKEYFDTVACPGAEP